MGAFKPNEAQLAAIEERGKNILVSAGAGSGKTTVLVERVLRMILEEKADIDELIVVTFTRAAAANMKEKIHSRIRSALKQESLPDADREHLQGQLMKVFGARICTLDSLCMDIVRENFQSVDIDPGFRVADEAEVTLLKQDVLSNMIEAHYTEPTEDFLTLVNYYTDKNEARLEDIILTLHKFSQSHPDPKGWILHAALPYIRADRNGALSDEQSAWIRDYGRFVNGEIRSLLKKAERGLALCLEYDGPASYADNFEKVRGEIAALLEDCFDGRVHGVRDMLEDWKRLPSAKKDEPDAIKKETAQALYGDIRDGLRKLENRFFYQRLEDMFADMKACSPVIKTICKLSLEYAERLAAEKKARMIADFNDIAHFAYRVLVETDENGNAVYTETADRMAKATREIIVDEYQDTNRMQDALIEALSAERFGRPNVFMVGDVKQSIYGFRLACPDLFNKKYNAFADPAGNGKRIILGANYRSRKEIVDFINLIFRRIMLADVGGIDYLDGHEMETGANFSQPEEGGGFSKEALLPEVLFIEGSGDAGKDAESFAIARKIEDLTEKHYITEPDGTFRKVRYSDIAILTRKTDHPRLERMLADRHIPLQKSSGKGFFSAFEVRLAINLMKIVDNPRQDIPLAAVLLSPLTGFRAETLARIRAAYEGEPFSLYEACLSFMEKDAGEEAETLRTLFADLEGWRKKAEAFPVVRFLDALLEESALYDCCSAMTYGEARNANLEFLKGLAESYSSGSYTGLFHFLRYIDAVQKADQDFGSGKQSVGEDAVTMMTIHKSKGLEFPVVILADAGKSILDLDSASPLFLDDELGIGIERRDLEQRTRRRTLMMELIAMKRKTNMIAEEIRLLYVAMSRAKEKLIITGSKGSLSSRRKVWEGEGISFEPDAASVLADNCYMFLLADAMTCAAEEKGSGFSWEVKDREELEIDRAQELFDEEEKRRQVEELIRVKSGEGADALQEAAGIYRYAYPYASATRTPVKMTPSETEQYVPARGEETEVRFRPEQGRLTGAERGSAYHKAFERLDYGAAAGLFGPEGTGPDPEKLTAFCRSQIRGFRDGGYLSEEEAGAIDPEKIAAFLLSPIGGRMRKAFAAGTLKREQQFVMAAEIDGDPDGLMQGIIDAFFTEETEAGKVIVLVDYKTDRNRSDEYFISAYRSQQEQYAAALEKATGLPVAERILYCVDTGKEIRLP